PWPIGPTIRYGPTSGSGTFPTIPCTTDNTPVSGASPARSPSNPAKISGRAAGPASIKPNAACIRIGKGIRNDGNHPPSWRATDQPDHRRRGAGGLVETGGGDPWLGGSADDPVRFGVYRHRGFFAPHRIFA